MLIIKSMGINISKQKAVITVGSQQRRFNVSLEILIKNFGYFKKRKNLPSVSDETVVFHFPTISESVMQSLFDFIEKGKQY